MIRFRYLSANYCPYEIPFRLLKICPFLYDKKNDCPFDSKQREKNPLSSYRSDSHIFISKRASSVISKRQTASFRNDSFAFDSSIINLNVLSKWQIIYHFEMRSHNLIPIRWVPDRSRQQDRERYRGPGTAPNFVRKICPAGQLSEWWYICKLSLFFSFWKFFVRGGCLFPRKLIYYK